MQSHFTFGNMEALGGGGLSARGKGLSLGASASPRRLGRPGLCSVGAARGRGPQGAGRGRGTGEQGSWSWGAAAPPDWRAWGLGHPPISAHGNLGSNLPTPWPHAAPACHQVGREDSPGEGALVGPPARKDQGVAGQEVVPELGLRMGALGTGRSWALSDHREGQNSSPGHSRGTGGQRALVARGLPGCRGCRGPGCQGRALAAGEGGWVYPALAGVDGQGRPGAAEAGRKSRCPFCDPAWVSRCGLNNQHTRGPGTAEGRPCRVWSHRGGPAEGFQEEVAELQRQGQQCAATPVSWGHTPGQGSRDPLPSSPTSRCQAHLALRPFRPDWTERGWASLHRQGDQGPGGQQLAKVTRQCHARSSHCTNRGQCAR